MRKPAVAGSFYPSEESELDEMIDGLLEGVDVEKKTVEDAISYVAPHAGYIYSGSVAAYTYKALSMRRDLNRIDSFVIVGPNHTGYGKTLSVSGEDWITPLGEVANDLELSREMVKSSGNMLIDEAAHKLEHSIEVQLPFLQKIAKNPRCCFICMGDQSEESSNLVADAIEKAGRKLGRKIAVIASSDFNHYETEEIARRKDLPAIKKLERLDTGGFNDLLSKNNDTACGYGPITVSALYARAHEAKKGVLLKYATSGEVTEDYSSVVAYSSIIFL